MVEPVNGLLADLRDEVSQLWPSLRDEAGLHKDIVPPTSVAALDLRFPESESKSFIQLRGLMYVIEESERQQTPELYLRQMRSLWPTVRIKLGVPDDVDVEMPEDLEVLAARIQFWYQRTQGKGMGFILAHFRGLLFLAGGPVDKR